MYFSSNMGSNLKNWASRPVCMVKIGKFRRPGGGRGPHPTYLCRRPWSEGRSGVKSLVFKRCHIVDISSAKGCRTIVGARICESVGFVWRALPLWTKIYEDKDNQRPECTGSREPFTTASLLGRNFRQRYRPHRKNPKCNGRVPATGLSFTAYVVDVNNMLQLFHAGVFAKNRKMSLFQSPFPIKISTVTKLRAP